MIILGLIGMFIQRITMPEFFKTNKPKVVDPAIARRRAGERADRRHDEPRQSSSATTGRPAPRRRSRVALEVGKAYGDKVIIAFGYELNPVAGEIHDYHAALEEMATKRLEEAKALAGAAPASRSRR